jgi:hypothetical protein
MVMVKWSKLTDISMISTNFNNKKSRNLGMVLIKFGFTILTTKNWNFGDGHCQIWIDHIDRGTSNLANYGHKIVVAPSPKFAISRLREWPLFMV